VKATEAQASEKHTLEAKTETNSQLIAIGQYGNDGWTY
jgi:hypothetical protein